MNFIDYYKTLGVDKKATKAEIKKAYRILARKFHPDLNSNNKEAELNFQKINEANNILSDSEKREKYDQYGKDWKHADEFEKSKRSHSSQQRAHKTSQKRGDFSDVFGSMFGNASRQGREVKFRGEDHQATLQLTLLDVYKKHQQTIAVNGKKIRITIPAGIENGQTIKIRNNGGQGVNGGSSGDLYITFSIASHPDFKRLRNDLYTNKEIDLYTAILGGEIIINTLNGKVKLVVKPETQNGNKVKLKGKGFPLYKTEGVFGDLYVTYNIKIPINLSDKQKELFTELSKM